MLRDRLHAQGVGSLVATLPDPAGWVVTISPPGRSLSQNDTFHGFCDEIAKARPEWNGMKILGASAGGYSMQIGANVSQTLTVSFSDIASLADVSAAILSTLDITASTALSKMDSAISAIDNFRTDLGSKINRLEYTVDNLTNISNNTSASRSRILDADYAKSSSELARTQIIQQAATAVLAQANVDQQSVLKLLQG